MGRNRLTNDQIDSRLVNRSIKRIDDYINNKTPINFQCLICNKMWKTTSQNVLDGCGCPYCAGTIHLSNVDVDSRLQDRNILRIDDYINNSTPIHFNCTICNFYWTAAPTSIFAGSGCPKCANHIKLTNIDVDRKLIDRNIQRLDDYINSNKSINFQCLICDYIWITSPRSILNNGNGCPKCSGKAKITNEYLDGFLMGKSIRRIGNINGVLTPISFQCQICDHMWRTQPAKIIHREQGCPQCNCPGQNEKLMHSILKNIKGYEIHYCINKISVDAPTYILDAFIPLIDVAIEYNGIQHYVPTGFGSKNPQQDFVRQQLRDEYIKNFCKDNNIILIEIDGRKYFGSKLKKVFNK